MSFTKEDEEGLFTRKKKHAAQAQLSKCKHKLTSTSYFISNNLNVEEN